MPYNRIAGTSGEGDQMKRMLRRLIILAALAGLGYFLWGERAKIAGLSNNHLRIQGTWYRVELDRKGVTPYYFSERIITVNDSEWGSYELLKNSEIEVTVGNEFTVYQLSFPDDENMVWSMEIDGKMTPVMRWCE
jgi:hypothetical protein